MPDRTGVRQRVSVMHMTDTLDLGGAERVAVNLVNCLPREFFHAHLCTTRRDGPLADMVSSDIPRVRLGRRHRLDARAVARLISYIREHRIDILHAHGASVFMAVLASLFPPYPRVLWHIHFGRYASDRHPGWLYRVISRRVRRIIAVNEALAAWARDQLHVSGASISYVPNFHCDTKGNGTAPVLPGVEGSRIVCVANVHPDKDHLTLLEAMERVIREVPAAQLLLVGEADGPYGRRIRGLIQEKGLGVNVTVLGQRRNVPAILARCDIGVLSSAAEGAPLALIEYGAARLPSVATDVGQCGDVLARGAAGLVVPPGAPDALAQALISLLKSPELRRQLGRMFHDRVAKKYAAPLVVARFCGLYYEVISARRGRGSFNGRSR